MDNNIKCPVCFSLIQSDSNIHTCDSCETPHHEDCWNYAEGCAVFGCRKVTRKTRQRDFSSDSLSKVDWKIIQLWKKHFSRQWISLILIPNLMLSAIIFSIITLMCFSFSNNDIATKNSYLFFPINISSSYLWGKVVTCTLWSSSLAFLFLYFRCSYRLSVLKRCMLDLMESVEGKGKFDLLSEIIDLKLWSNMKGINVVFTLFTGLLILVQWLFVLNLCPKFHIFSTIFLCNFCSTFVAGLGLPVIWYTSIFMKRRRLYLIDSYKNTIIYS